MGSKVINEKVKKLKKSAYNELKKIDDLGKPIQFDNDYFPESMVKIYFKGCNNSFKCKGKKAGQFLFKAFNKEKKYQQKNPGELIKAMAMYEVFFANQFWDARKNFEADYLKNQLIRFKGNIARTSTFVGMDRSALHRKIKELNIDIRDL